MPKISNLLSKALRVLTMSLAATFVCAGATSITAADVPLGRMKSHQKPRSKPIPQVPVSEEMLSPVPVLETAAERSAQGVAVDFSPQPASSFLALDDNGTAAPPDTSGAVGPTHLVVALASELRYQSRTGDSIFRTNMDAFWAGISANVFDPRVVYDPYGQRFIMSASGDPGGSAPRILLAVSKTSNPEDGWFRFGARTDLANAVYPDSPTLGFNKDWIVVQANMYDEATFEFFRSEVYVYTKGSVYSGVEDLRKLSFLPAMGASQVPAVTMDPAATNIYMMMNWNGSVTNEFGDRYGYLRIFSIAGAVGSERIITTNSAGRPIFVTKTFGPWESFAPNDADFLPQLGSPNKIYAGDARIQNVVYREGLLWATHTAFFPAVTPNRAAVQWWAVTPGGLILQNSTIEDPSGATHFAYPSIAVNGDNDALIGYSRFSAAQYPSADYSFRAGTDAFGYLREDVLLKAGEAPYYVPIFSQNRWGDWSATMIDPNGDTDFWTIQEYAAAPIGGIDRWGTWWGRVSPPSDLAITMTDAPDPINAGQNITYSLVVTNKQDQRVSGAKVAVTLPPGAVLSSATPSRGSCTLAGDVVNCLLGPLNPFAVETISIIVTANQAGSATNVAVLSANGPDKAPADNTAIAITDVRPSADLRVTCVDSPDPVTAGSNVTYSITVSNRGPSTASGVFVTNTLPSGFSVVSVTTSQGIYSQAGNILTFTLASINAGAVANITIVATTTGSGTVTNQTQVIASTADSNTANNLAQTPTRVNARPVITPNPIPTQNLNEDTVFSVPFTVSDAETTAGSLQVAVSSSNPGIIPNSGLSVSGTGGTKTLAITPALNQFGSNTTITITVTDPDGAFTTAAFLANVAAVNDAPTISNIPDPAPIDEDTSTNLTFTINDVDTPLSALTLSATSSDTTIVPLSNITFTGTGASRTVTVRPTTNEFGSVTITVRVNDGALTASDPFVLTINSVNDLPVISTIADQTTSEDTPTPAISFNISDVENPATNLVTVASSSNQSLVSNTNLVITGLNATRTLVATPALNQSGSALITVTVIDRRGDSVSTTFTLSVLPVNDPPSMDPIANVNSTEDVGRLTVALTGIDSGAGNESQTLAVTATTDRPDILTNLQSIYTSAQSTGMITFDTVQDAFGTAVVTVTVDDGQTTNRFFSRSFTVTLTGINDPPTLDPIGTVTVDEDAGERTIDLTGISAGPANETNQTVTFTATSSSPALIPTPTVNYTPGTSNAVLRFTPAANASGSSTITVTANDGRVQNPTITRTFTINVTSVNDLPIISNIATQRINEDAVLSAIPFTVQDVESAAGSLTPLGTSSNPALVPNGNITFGGTGASRNVTVTPLPNQFGSATISIRVTDPDGGSSTNSFLLTVDPVNDLPTFSGLPSQPVLLQEDAGEQVLNLSNITPGPANESSQVLTVRATSSNPGLIPNPAVEYTNPSQTAIVRYSPAANSNGTATISITVQDDAGGQSLQTFQVSVASVNDLPSISDIADQTIDEDALLTGVAFVIDDVETAPGALQLTGSSSNPELIADTDITFGGSGKNRTVSVRPLTNEFGSAFIFITVTDGNNESVTTGFVLTVNEVNDLPTISAIAAQTIQQNTSTATLPFQIADAETPANALRVAAISSNLSLVPNANIILGGTGANRNVTITPVAGRAGTTTITIMVDDGVQTNSMAFLLLVNSTPTISGIANQVSDEDVPITQSFTINDGETAPGSLTLSAISSNPAIVPNNGVTFGGSGVNRTVTVTPVLNQSGSANITITVDDGSGASAQTVFAVTFNAVNDPPAITAIGTRTTLEDTATGLINFSVSDVESAASSLTVLATSSNPVLVPSSQLVVTGTGANRSLNILPATNQNGSATISITARDPQGAQTVLAFTLNVTPVNDAPLVSTVPGQTTEEDVAISVPVGISDLETAADSLTLTATSANTTLVPNANLVPGGSGSSRTLVITPAANQSGSANITITVSDGVSNTLRTFTLTVTSKNDPPTLATISNVSFNEDAGQQVITLTGIATGAANESQSLTFTTSSSNPSVIPTPVVNYTNGNSTASLLLNPVANASGVAVITIALSDGQDQVTQTFTVTVNAVNDAPALSGIVAQTTAEDTPITVNFTVSDAETASAFLSLSATSSSAAVVPVTNIVFNGSGTSRFMTITPAPHASGTTTITLSASDGTNTTSTNFLVTVNAFNDAPTLDPINNLSLTQNPPNQTVNLTGISAGPNESQSLSVKVVSSNTSLIPTPSVSYTSPNTTGSITMNPANSGTGTSVISVTVGDSGTPSNSITRSFTVYIRASNNGNPTIAGLTNVSINEDTPITIPFTVNDDGGTSTLSLAAASSNTNLLTTNALVFGGSGSSRTLTITPSLNQFGTSMVTVAVSDTGFGYVATNFVLTVNSVNDLPVISPISLQTISEDGVLSSLAFTVSDAETPGGALNVTANSSNLGLVPLSNIALGGTGTNRAITITPVAQQSGASTITLTVTDGNGAVTNTTFVLNVTSQNDPPTISDISNQTINEDSTTGLIAFTIGDAETAAASLQVGVSSSNPALVPTNNIVLAGSGASRTVMLTPLPDQFGVSTISVTVTDGALTATDTFLLTVNSQNDAPTLNAISNLTIDKDSGQQTVNLSGISFGPANESQTLAVSVDSSNPAIVPRPSVSYTSPAATGTLAFTPVAGTNGTATISVTVSDGQSVNGSVTRTFSVTVREGQPPAVAIARSGPNVIVSWPAVGSFTLQSITAVPPVGTWSDAGITPILVGTNYTATIPANTSQKFYRLRN